MNRLLQKGLREEVHSVLLKKLEVMEDEEEVPEQFPSRYSAKNIDSILEMEYFDNFVSTNEREREERFMFYVGSNAKLCRTIEVGEKRKEKTKRIPSNERSEEKTKEESIVGNMPSFKAEAEEKKCSLFFPAVIAGIVLLLAIFVALN